MCAKKLQNNYYNWCFEFELFLKWDKDTHGREQRKIQQCIFDLSLHRTNSRVDFLQSLDWPHLILLSTVTPRYFITDFRLSSGGIFRS